MAQIILSTVFGSKDDKIYQIPTFHLFPKFHISSDEVIHRHGQTLGAHLVRLIILGSSKEEKSSNLATTLSIHVQYSVTKHELEAQSSINFPNGIVVLSQLILPFSSCLSQIHQSWFQVTSHDIDSLFYLGLNQFPHFSFSCRSLAILQQTKWQMHCGVVTFEAQGFDSEIHTTMATRTSQTSW